MDTSPDLITPCSRMHVRGSSGVHDNYALKVLRHTSIFKLICRKVGGIGKFLNFRNGNSDGRDLLFVITMVMHL